MPLHLEPGGGDSVVCAQFDDDATGDSLEDVSTPRDLAMCAPSFESFMKRFWLENAPWFACSKGAPLSPKQKAYADAATKARASL